MTVYVSGSLAYDRIMDFPGKFADHIIKDKLDVLNVSFMVDKLAERMGGTAGNIAYALSLLGEKPAVLSALGKDNRPYLEHLNGLGVITDGILIIAEENTASAYITTDRDDNQITTFNPGAMKFPSLFPFATPLQKGDIGIVAPGNIEDMQSYSQYYKTSGIYTIFDPGQSLPSWDSVALTKCINGCTVLISNEYELQLITEMTGLSRKKLCLEVESLITTKGGEGSVVYSAGCEVQIPSVKPKQVKDPSGAGDAYRGGLIYGLLSGEPLDRAALIGSVCASFAIELKGAQEYILPKDEFAERLRIASG